MNDENNEMEIEKHKLSHKLDDGVLDDVGTPWTKIYNSKRGTFTKLFHPFESPCFLEENYDDIFSSAIKEAGGVLKDAAEIALTGYGTFCEYDRKKNAKYKYKFLKGLGLHVGAPTAAGLGMVLTGVVQLAASAIKLALSPIILPAAFINGFRDGGFRVGLSHMGQFISRQTQALLGNVAGIVAGVGSIAAAACAPIAAIGAAIRVKVHNDKIDSEPKYHRSGVGDVTRRRDDHDEGASKKTRDSFNSVTRSLSTEANGGARSRLTATAAADILITAAEQGNSIDQDSNIQEAFLQLLKLAALKKFPKGKIVDREKWSEFIKYYEKKARISEDELEELFQELNYDDNEIEAREIKNLTYEKLREFVEVEDIDRLIRETAKPIKAVQAAAQESENPPSTALGLLGRPTAEDAPQNPEASSTITVEIPDWDVDPEYDANPKLTKSICAKFSRCLAEQADNKQSKIQAEQYDAYDRGQTKIEIDTADAQEKNYLLQPHLLVETLRENLDDLNNYLNEHQAFPSEQELQGGKELYYRAIEALLRSDAGADAIKWYQNGDDNKNVEGLREFSQQRLLKSKGM